MSRIRAMTTALLLGITSAVAAPATADPGPPFCEGTFTDLGSPLASITVHEGGYGTGPDGRLAGYALLSGDNAALNRVDAQTGERLGVFPLSGASGGWGITVDDQQRVYVGTYTNAGLYSYDPQTDAVTDHGSPIPGEAHVYGLSHSPDGTIYGGTYPNAHAFAFDPDTGEVTDFGTFTLDGAKYVRATAFDPDTGTLFIGLGATGARLFAIDVATGESREMALPDSADAAIITDLRYRDGKVFGYVGAQLVVVDAVTGEHLPLTDGSTGAQVDSTRIISRGLSEPMDGVVYYSDFAPGTSRHRLMALDLATLEFNAAPVQDGAPPLAGAALGFGFTEGTNGPVLHAFTGNYGGQAVQYDIAGAQLELLAYDVQPTAPNLGQVTTSPDGDVYVNAFLNGNTARFDPDTGQSTGMPRFGQVEGWIWHNGLLYTGIYPYGAVRVWDPAEPQAAPTELFALEESHHQNRPMTLVADDERLYVGTTPGYGLHGGAVTVYDFATGEFDVYRHVVPDQSVSALLKVGDVLLGGSSIDGGTGTNPIASEATLFVLDPETGEVLEDFAPVEGAHSINALIEAADGTIWGLADGTAFTFDLESGRVTRSIEVFADLASGATDGELVEYPDGRIFGNSRNRLFEIDPDRRTSRIVRDDVRRLALHRDGDLYTLLRSPDGDTADTNRLARYEPGPRRPGPGCRSVT